MQILKLGNIKYSSNVKLFGTKEEKKIDTMNAQKNDEFISSQKNINKSLEYLKGVKFKPKDLATLKMIGVSPPFYSGAEAVRFIKNNNVKIVFDAMNYEDAHAQYDFETNSIKINKKYEHTNSEAEILAISSAILHESGHAKDFDGYSSIQEEVDCLALNALAHRYFAKKYKNIFTTSDAPIIIDGVSLYAELFFDKDLTKKQLSERIKSRYGELPVGDIKHMPTPLAYSSKK